MERKLMDDHLPSMRLAQWHLAPVELEVFDEKIECNSTKKLLALSSFFVG